MRPAFEAIAASDLDCTTLTSATIIEPGERTGISRLGGRIFLSDENGDC